MLYLKLQLNTEEAHKSYTHQSCYDKSYADATQGRRHIAVRQFLPDGSYADNGKQPADA